MLYGSDQTDVFLLGSRPQRITRRSMEPPPAKRAKGGVPKVAKVKNKMPAEVQITAEQLLQEAAATKVERVAPPPRQKVTSAAELADLQMRKRKEFEDNIRKNRSVMANWIKYAVWEESQNELERARSVFERALDVNHRTITTWLKYAEMEMKRKQINHARNIWDRAVTILPRVNQFWYKYSYMEEMLGNIVGARQVGSELDPCFSQFWVLCVVGACWEVVFVLGMMVWVAKIALLHMA